jgi:hypothetical protein
VSRAAAILAVLPAVVFGIPCIFAIRFFSERGYVWTFMGFPTYGQGPFEAWGFQTTTGLLVAFLLVCVAELVVAVLLWRETRTGVVLSLALLPIEFLSGSGSRCHWALWSGWRERRWPSQAGSSPTWRRADA